MDYDDDNNNEGHNGSFDIDGNADDYSHEDIGSFDNIVEGGHNDQPLDGVTFGGEKLFVDEITMKQAKVEWFNKTKRKGTKEDHDEFGRIFGEMLGEERKEGHGYRGATVDQNLLIRTQNVSGNVEAVIKAVASGSDAPLFHLGNSTESMLLMPLLMPLILITLRFAR